jgi:hypothetical protein
VYTYRETAPGSADFNGAVYGAGSNTNENGTTITHGLAEQFTAVPTGFTLEEYGAALSGTPVTGHMRLRTNAANATPGVGYITVHTLNPTACVVPRSGFGGGAGYGFTVGEQATINNAFVAWSPLAVRSRPPTLIGVNATAAAILASGVWCPQLVTDSGVCSVVRTVNAHAGTEEVRWTL